MDSEQGSVASYFANELREIADFIEEYPAMVEDAPSIFEAIIIADKALDDLAELATAEPEDLAA